MMILRFVLGDQLNEKITSLVNANCQQDIILMCEVNDEATYVKHHKKKLVLIFSAMRHFAKHLIKKGYQVDYRKIDDDDNTGSLSGELMRAIDHYKPTQVVVTAPGEYRILQLLQQCQKLTAINIDIKEDTRFLCRQSDFSDWVAGRRQLRMEYFYREMRKKHAILMTQQGKPIGGKWNYDKANRHTPDNNTSIPAAYSSHCDTITQEVIMLVKQRFPDHFGDIDGFSFAVTRQQALQVLDHFINKALTHFGDYQDAMLTEQAWMYHSHLSFYLNCGLLLPMECIRKVEQAYHDGLAPINAVEGFIRQILGWREYIRGIYWHYMPDYENNNYLDATQPLPDWFWTGNTDLYCLKACIRQTKQFAYAHHIQRLMVLGNFTLLTGIDPNAVNEWYMIVYADAYQWVELPNVSGMVLFADAGLLASKPYAASGAYINKMSDYCQHCRYDVKQKQGDKACPFNYLYWDFFMRHQTNLSSNHRLMMVYNTLKRMSSAKKQMIRDDSKQFLQSMSE